MVRISTSARMSPLREWLFTPQYEMANFVSDYRGERNRQQL